MKLRYVVVLEALLAGGLIGILPLTAPTSHAATQQKKPAISEEASAALMRMGQTLRSEQFSFQARTIREYSDAEGHPLHIFHTLKVTAHRPNRLLVDRTGDDGASKLVFDGKTAIVYSATEKKYAGVPVPEGTIAGMLTEVVGRLGVDFPLADFLTEDPDNAFLTGVTEGTVVNTVTIDGVPWLHLFFFQPPGIELELWVEKNDQSLPRRLIVTYRTLPGQPNFIAEFSDWNFNIHPSDADFTFQPPADATEVQLKPVAATAPPVKGKAKGQGR
ncbi:MAG: DUF2092 domain-containing protein [Stellaceae bacterium]